MNRCEEVNSNNGDQTIPYFSSSARSVPERVKSYCMRGRMWYGGICRDESEKGMHKACRTNTSKVRLLDATEKEALKNAGGTGEVGKNGEIVEEA